MDVGTMIAAGIAAAVALFVSWRSWLRDKGIREEYWLRELRIPRYVEFVRAADVFRLAIFLEHGEWDYQDMGPEPKDPPTLTESRSAFRHAKNEIAFVGPASVALAATHVQYSLAEYEGALEHGAYIPHDHLTRARDEFSLAATNAVGLAFQPDSAYETYNVWQAEQRAIDKANEQREEEERAARHAHPLRNFDTELDT